MSASLVGSEMCIRDSRRIAIAESQSAEVGPPAWPGTRGTALQSSGQNSVSYTHLTLPTICSV
eukprot:13070660-Alexandrium_andersonii.AAC.1